jgi:hypothetical protein
VYWFSEGRLDFLLGFLAFVLFYFNVHSFLLHPRIHKDPYSSIIYFANKLGATSSSRKNLLT